MNKMIQIPVDDLEDTLAVLHLATSSYQSQDVADAYNNLQQTVKYRPITNELARVHERLSGFLKDYVFDNREAEEQEENGEE
jgi:hypothetical protein